MKPELSESHLEAWRKYYVSFWRVYGAIETDLAAAGLHPAGRNRHDRHNRADRRRFSHVAKSNFRRIAIPPGFL